MEHWLQSVAVNKLALNIYNQCVDAEGNYFLIGVIDDQTRVATYGVISPVARSQRAIKFNVPTNATPFNALKTNSFYNVVVYEQTNNSNTSPTNAVVLGLRWEGTMIIDADSEVTFTEYANPTARNYVYYNTED